MVSKDFIFKHQELGSFDTWVEILNYLRLSLHENRKIEIQNIAPFWTKYHQRKDYSVYNIAVALTIFEEKGFIDKLISCNLIHSIQNVSEKCYRGLLAEYIMLHSVDIIQYINVPHKHISLFFVDFFIYALIEGLETFLMSFLFEYSKEYCPLIQSTLQEIVER